MQVSVGFQVCYLYIGLAGKDLLEDADGLGDNQASLRMDIDHELGLYVEIDSSTQR